MKPCPSTLVRYPRIPDYPYYHLPQKCHSRIPPPFPSSSKVPKGYPRLHPPPPSPPSKVPRDARHAPYPLQRCPRDTSHAPKDPAPHQGRRPYQVLLVMTFPFILKCPFITIYVSPYVAATEDQTSKQERKRNNSLSYVEDCQRKWV